MIDDPDYARIFTKARCIAWSYGYACVAHGSFTRDLDLLFVPWEERATSEIEPFVKYIASSCDLEIMDKPPSKRPHGRLSFTLTFKTFGDPRFVDISVFPPLPKEGEL